MKSLSYSWESKTRTLDLPLGAALGAQGAGGGGGAWGVPRMRPGRVVRNGARQGRMMQF